MRCKAFPVALRHLSSPSPPPPEPDARSLVRSLAHHHASQSESSLITISLRQTALISSYFYVRRHGSRTKFNEPLARLNARVPQDSQPTGKVFPSCNSCPQFSNVQPVVARIRDRPHDNHPKLLVFLNVAGA